MPGTISKGISAVGERGDFFGSTAKDERVAALEADDAAIRARMLDHQRVDLFLSDALCAAAFADVDDFGGGRSEIENRLRNEVVVEDDVGGLDKAQRFDGEQVGIARAGADERDLALLLRLAGKSSLRAMSRDEQVGESQIWRCASSWSRSLRSSLRGWVARTSRRSWPRLSSHGPRSAGSCSSISRRRRCAKAGLSPAVEMAICRSPRLTTEPKKKSQLGMSSTLLHRMLRVQSASR